ncbi:MAG: HAD-IIIA family hydrolase [Flavobacteriales bacterium]|nr:HAD-IIIA family hydrolase [Flavobacteriales bacterium]
MDKTWTLFLDRDGVINKRLIDDYVKSVDEFKFLYGAKKAIAAFSQIFGRIIVVTNQQGIGKGLMSVNDLEQIHQKMKNAIEKSGGRIDKIYHCPQLKTVKNNCRKPNNTMGLMAKKDFPEIDFKKSLMIGDSISDLKFAQNLGMQSIFIKTKKEESEQKITKFEATSLYSLASYF